MQRASAFLHKHRRAYWRAWSATFLLWFLFCLQGPSRMHCFSTVLYDRNGKLLGARVSADGQWRFAPAGEIPAKFETCLLEFEDRNFYRHSGVSYRALGRAFLQNVKNAKIVSGASTITMQTVKLYYTGKDRSLTGKATQMCMAWRLETEHSKAEILKMYCAAAPFGNNVVGLDAAAWRYFGRSAGQLSWAECATLAILPNAPGLIYPGKNHKALLAKRNRLLKRLYQLHKIDAADYELALTEPIPGAPLPLPDLAPHVLQYLIQKKGAGKTFHSTLDAGLQQMVSDRLLNYGDKLRSHEIQNAATIVTSTATGEVLASLGNLPDASSEDGKDVDCSRALRSSGSILKPLLFEAALEEGMMTPKTLLLDVPSQFGGYAPKNFSKSYEGAIRAEDALAKSLNIPFVLLLKQYGAPRFCQRLRDAGLKSISSNPARYGLTLILGGAEVNLQSITGVYRDLGATCMQARTGGLVFLKDENPPPAQLHCDPTAVFQTLQSMTEPGRPDEEGNWKLFASSRKIAWKTGTSFGFRDGWSVGITPDYTIGVWCGNATGEGKPGLTGIKAAAPFMFELFSALPGRIAWFTPELHTVPVQICAESGFAASVNCPHTQTSAVPKGAGYLPVCQYHQVLTLSPDGRYRASSQCFEVGRLQQDTFFVLPPLAAHYYKMHAAFREIPPWCQGCGSAETQSLSLLYPKNGVTVYLPKTETGKTGEMVMEAASPGSSVLYWHLDDTYMGSTERIHHLVCQPASGVHRVSVVDAQGQGVTVGFVVKQ